MQEHSVGLPQAVRAEIKQDKAWEDLWRRLFGERDIQRPVIDFADESILVIALGSRASGGYSVSAELIDVRDGHARIRVIESVPAQGCTVTTLLTHPTIVVAVSPPIRKASFEEWRVERSCR